MLPQEGDTSTLNGRKLQMVYENHFAFILEERSCGMTCLTQLAVSITSVIKEAGELILCLAVNSAF